MQDLKKNSPFGVYVEHLRKGELAYQATGDGKAVFFPRVVAPGTGSPDLEWRVSKGLGTVHATTVVHYKGEAPLNVALIDLDEGFRMMSRVEDTDPMQVKIGMRVKAKVLPGDEKQPPYPVFVPIRSSDTSPGQGRGEARTSPSPPGRRGRDEGKGGAK
ncbi:MAG: OB-fold domain-containing protein [Betaproteobacteria bacterium]|nr:OB-fold domain-containing protein [Betaproteobacteria bacterium]